MIARHDEAIAPRVLVLEDETFMAQRLELVLKEEGYGVCTTHTGLSALKTLGQRGFDLLITDLRLPDMDGMDVVKRVKEEQPDTQVIVITGYANIPSAIEAMKTGVADYLPKPFTDDELISSITEALSHEKAVHDTELGGRFEAGHEKLIPKGEVIRALRKANKQYGFMRRLAERTGVPLGEISLIAEHMQELEGEDMDLLCRCSGPAPSGPPGDPTESEAPEPASEPTGPSHEPAGSIMPGDYTSVIEEKWMDTAEHLARSCNFQNKLIESSIDGIVACDEEGRVLVFNHSMERMLGYDRAEVINVMYLDHFFLIAGVEELKKMMRSEDYGGKDRLFLYETSVIDKAGVEVPVQFSAAFLYEGREEVGMVAFLRDLREARKAEMQLADQASLIHQDKMVSMGKLAASIAHEINNPLAGVLNYIRLMLKMLGRGETLTLENQKKFQRYLNLVETETSRCSTIISSLLAFSRKSKAEVGEVNVNELIEKCILLCRHKLELQNIRVEIQLAKDIPAVRADFNQMQQCLINLILNAIDAMSRGGVLTVRSVPDPGSRTVKIVIGDTGCGIPKEDLARIFDPFYTTKKEGAGLGLGLSTVFGIVDRHKGVITVESETGKGTAFTITLPSAG
jgi:PAS domain S-box-containing protein